MSRMIHEPKHLLDTPADQNIGNGGVVQPQAGGATVVPQTNPDRVLMLSGPSGTGQTTSIALTASRIVGPNNPNPGVPGPITGVIEFGNGGQFTRVEVDIPIGPFAGTFTQAAPSTEPQDGGVIVTVPTGVLRVYARYDNNFILPTVNSLPPQSLAQSNGTVPFIGPGGALNLFGTVIPAEPVQVKAMAAYYSRHTSKVYRTQYLYVGDDSTGVPTPIALPGAFFCVPPFARSLKVLRFNGNKPAGVLYPGLEISLLDNCNHLLDHISIPAGTSSPIIPIIGTETIVFIQGANPITDVVTLLAFCYEIGI